MTINQIKTATKLEPRKVISSKICVKPVLFYTFMIFQLCSLFILAFVTSDVTTDPLYYYSATPNTIWPSRIYQSISNIPSQIVCSAMCTLTSVNCQVYVHVSSTQTCYLGSFAVPLTSTSVAVVQGGTELMHTRISAIGESYDIFIIICNGL